MLKKQMFKPVFTTISIIIVLLSSCKQTKLSKIDVLEIKETTVSKKEETKPNEELYIVNDSLVITLLYKLEKIVLNKKFTTDKKPVKNKHVKNLIDTIINKTYKNTKITSYKATNKEWICKAKIENSEFRLNEFIMVGTKKHVVEKSLSKIIKNDTLKIGDLESNSVFSLIFESDILKTIEFSGYLD